MADASKTSEPSPSPSCARCRRDLSGERPVLLPDGQAYCAACCEGMATEAFELETGEPFVKWIEKHPVLVLRHQPLELSVRRMGFLIPMAFACGSLLLAAYGLFKLAGRTPDAPPARSAAPAEKTPRKKRSGEPGGLGYLLVGGSALALFGWLAARQGQAYLRAVDFKLTLQEGRFRLEKGPHRETFHIDDVQQACVVRPGTVGATEGALGLADGRMLTLDTCLTDLHALGVIMDLRLREDFPPSLEERMRERRERLRKIRGLS